MKTKTTLAALLLAAVFTLQTQAFGMDLPTKPGQEVRAAMVIATSNEKVAAQIAQQMMFLSGAIVFASLVGAGTVVLTKTSFLNNRL
jgi:hypothetical protein